MIAPDVNVIFYFLDVKSHHYFDVRKFIKQNPRRTFVILSKVSSHFIATYSGYITDVGSIIEDVILSYKSQRKSQAKLTARDLTLILEPKIENRLRQLAQETSYSFSSLRYFKDLLLAEYSLSDLYYDSVFEFREKVITRSTEISLDLFNSFLKQLNYVRAMKLSAYRKYDEFLAQISYSDYEDRQVYAEACAFCFEFSPLKMYTFDKSFRRFIASNVNRFCVGLV